MDGGGAYDSWIGMLVSSLAEITRELF